MTSFTSLSPLPTSLSSQPKDPIIELLPSPCLHIVQECLDPYEVITLTCLSKGLHTLINSPSLYWLRFGRTVESAKKRVHEEREYLHSHIMARARAPSWGDLLTPSVNASKFLSCIEFISRSHCAPMFYHRASRDYCEPHGKLLLALAATLNPRLRPYADERFVEALKKGVKQSRLRYTSFGALSDNARGFRGRDIPSYIEISIDEISDILAPTLSGDKKGTTKLSCWNRVLEINATRRPMTCEPPVFCIA
ncbi:hypothetical protein TrST_g13313 [Triparma strigata]|uniref:F-box domain-containing protein n=1 Tax=Triparma strigata TaxID=1606541 RepID=A0A9W7DW57_9STRA|nr:hypothetical protein TrST_g13313 [Triparma strigata]